MLFSALMLLGVVGTAGATHSGTDTLGHTTIEQTVGGGDPAGGYQTLGLEPGSPLVVRDPAGLAQAGREQRRESVAYFAQLTDFQLADEESPARVEFTDQDPSGTARAAWRPYEALMPFAIDYSIRQVNAFAGASPFAQGDGTENSMDFALMTGDQADNQQRNETVWVRELLDGGSTLRFDTGIDPTGYDPTLPGCAQAQLPPELQRLKSEADSHNYTGVQDYDDYDEGPNPYYYDPDDVRGFWADQGWPTYTGLMDRAQQFQLTPAGLDVPWYLTNGNHDVLVQGNQAANQSFEQIALGCSKTLASTQSATSGPDPDALDPTVLLAPPSASMLVPPDPQRQLVSKPQIKQIYGQSSSAADPLGDDHGFGYVDPAENAASNGSASYYAWDPPQTPGVRFISIDTNSEGGVTPVSSSGNIDDPQFQWLEGELEAASQRNELIVIFGHHPVRSLNADVPDEAAPPCKGNDSHGHDINPGCDLDPRQSEPVHLGEDPQPGDPRESLVELMDRFPNVVAYVPGHTHENRVTSFTRGDGSVWWELNTSAVADWPQQHRLIDVMDNRDGTLSILSAVLDHASPAASPPSGDASSFDAAQLASIARTMSYNDPQADLGADGGPADQNVELLVEDPRPGADLSITKSDSPDPVAAGTQLTYTLQVHNAGPADSRETVVTDDLPGGVGFDSATPSQGSCSQASGTVTCELGTLAANGSASIQVKVTPQSAGTITNQASVEGNVKDTNPANDSDTESTTVQAAADLSIAKSDSPDPAAIGRNLTYSLAVTNHGPSGATGIVVTDRLPSRVNFVSASASQGTCAFSKGTVTCQLGSLPSGGSATVTVRVTPRNVGTLSNTAGVRATQQDPSAANNSDTESTKVVAK